MSIKVVIAKPHGYCGNEHFGVYRAIKLAEKAAKENPGKTYLLGEIVHNQQVVNELERKYKVKTVCSINKIPQGSTVVIRAHGTVPQVFDQAREKRLKIIDATCPLVSQVHKDVKSLAKAGKKVLYIASKKDHDEAMGVAAEAPATVKLITLQELARVKIDDPKNTFVLTQTTLSILDTEKALKKLKAKYPGIIVKSHICMATTQRQKAVIKLAKEVGFVVIVGHSSSSNANRLKEVARASGAQAYLVDTAGELDPSWFKGVGKVALSSGASTPERLLKKVIEKIKGF